MIFWNCFAFWTFWPQLWRISSAGIRSWANFPTQRLDCNYNEVAGCFGICGFHGNIFGDNLKWSIEKRCHSIWAELLQFFLLAQSVADFLCRDSSFYTSFCSSNTTRATWARSSVDIGLIEVILWIFYWVHHSIIFHSQLDAWVYTVEMFWNSQQKHHFQEATSQRYHPCRYNKWLVSLRWI